MNVRRSFVRVTALTVVLAMPLMGMSGIASAKATKAAKGTPAWCAKHAKNAVCHAGSGGGGGTGGSSGPQITVQVDPQPLVETGQSEVHVVVQVETLPAFAGDTVNIDSSQLSASCSSVIFENLQNGSTTASPNTSDNRIDAVLDDDGNATVIVDGFDCAPGSSVIEADLEVSPFLTALTTLVTLPPRVTPEGVIPYPQTGGLLQEIETGDTSSSGDSNVYAVFYVETNPVYAEQPVEISDNQLFDSCITSSVWYDSFTDYLSGSTPQETLDDDGNAVFVFVGSSCAAGTTEVIADVLAGSHPTYVTTYTVDPPAPTI